MKPYVASRSPCPIGRASRLLGDRWVLLLLRELFLGVDRFVRRLEWLVDAGVVAREPPDARRARYRLTEAGRALAPALDAIRHWGDAWLPPVGADANKAPRPIGRDASQAGLRE
jgi:DNA-binding HxlR family transcriptional regulator